LRYSCSVILTAYRQRQAAESAHFPTA